MVPSKPRICPMSEMDLKSLLGETCNALRTSLMRRLTPASWRRESALATAIEAYLADLAPSALACAAAAAARQREPSSTTVAVAQDESCICVSATGVWVRSWRLIDWETLLDHLPPLADAGYQRAFEALASSERTVFLLHRQAGLEFGEIANCLQVDVQTCEQLLAKALSAMARHLEKDEQ